MDTTIEIIDYSDQYAEDFKRLNLEWLEKYNLLETHDQEVIDDPRGTILNTGGAIYLAKAGDAIVGSAGLAKTGIAELELAKMAVTPAWQGKGISRLLIEKCLEKAKALGAEKVSLFSNHQLTTAIGLYEKYGFRHVEVADSPFATADVKMELDLVNH
jgi:GNAT superfamily N-acetyltransferase